MSVNWSWPKVTALTTVQSAASSMLGLLVGHEFLQIDWEKSLQVAGMTAAVTFLRAVVAYALPSGNATALASASVGAAQDASDAAVAARPFVAESNEARG